MKGTPADRRPGCCTSRQTDSCFTEQVRVQVPALQERVLPEQARVLPERALQQALPERVPVREHFDCMRPAK